MKEPNNWFSFAKEAISILEEISKFITDKI